VTGLLRGGAFKIWFQGGVSIQQPGVATIITIPNKKWKKLNREKYIIPE
jgi:hypothetical protein